MHADEQIEDHYPSRGGRRAGLIERQDPVIYSAADKPSPLTRAQLNQYDTQGFLLIEGVFSEQEMTCFKLEMDRLRQARQVSPSRQTITEPQSNRVRSIFQIHQDSPVFSKMASDPRLAEIARYLLGDEVYIHQSRLNFKPAFDGRPFYWHSDFETWHVEDGMPAMRALSISVTLTENHQQNGPLMVVPGSHRQYVVCEGETPQAHFKTSLKNQEYGIPDDRHLSELIEHHGLVTTTGKPGSIILFDCNLMHGSNGNITPFPRSNAFFVYNAMSNRVLAPFCEQPPRPEYICSRQNITAVVPQPFELLHSVDSEGEKS